MRFSSLSHPMSLTARLQEGTIAGSAVSSTAEKRIDANPALKTAFKNIKTSTDLEASLQPVLDIVTNNGIDQSELELALQKLLKTVRDAKT